MEDVGALDVVVGEGKDSLQGNWTTDLAVCTLAILLACIAWHHTKRKKGSTAVTPGLHFWYFAGTAWAFFFGMFAHHYFPNRAQDGVGQYEFYVFLVLGYFGTYLRVGFGLALPRAYQYAGACLGLAMITAMVCVLRTMEIVSTRTDDIPSGEVKEGREIAQLFDMAFAIAEVSFAIYEVVGLLHWFGRVKRAHRDCFAVFGMLFGVSSWLILYGVKLLYFKYRYDYDQELALRIFEYLQIGSLMMVFTMENGMINLRKWVTTPSVPSASRDPLMAA